MKSIQIIIVVFAIFNAVSSIAAEWVSIDETNQQFDKSRIKIDKTSGNLLIWKKFELFDNEVEELGNLRKNGKPIDYSNYSYSIHLTGVNCKDETLGTISGTDYDYTGRVISSWEAEKLQLSPVIPETIGEAFVQAVCKFVAKEKQKKK